MRPLLANLLRFQNSIAGVLAGHNPGNVYVNQPNNPDVVLVISPEGAFVAGDTPSTDLVAALKNHVVALMENSDTESLWFTVDPTWEALRNDFLPRPPLSVARQHYSCTAPAFDWRTNVPEGFAVHAIDQALFDRPELTIPDHIHEWIETNWKRRDDFFAHGFGFVTEALDTRSVASWSICDAIGDNACEIGIRTHPDYRRRGLAALTSAAAVDHALAQGHSRVGWHCNIDNPASQSTALRVGFTLERNYVSYAAFRREAVHWAEAGRLQEIAGDYRAAAEYYIRADACDDKPVWGNYIPYYAASAFATAGDYDAAWTWLNRAVAQGFDDVDTLQSDEAFVSLQDTAAWAALLQSLG